MRNLIPTENWDYGFCDFLRGLKCTFSLRNIEPTLYLPGIGHCIPTRSGRNALVSAIKSLDIPPHSRIAVPLYTCTVVFKAIIEAECIPCFIDIDPSTFCISVEDLFKKRNNFDAVIAVHMFGNVCDMDGLNNVVGAKPIIEDCAQSLGSKHKNSMTGSLGSIAVFSFRSGKYLSVGEGGALFTHDRVIMHSLSQKNSSLPTPGFIDELQHVTKTFLRSTLRSKPFYGLAGYHLWQLYTKNRSYISKTPIINGKIFYTDYVSIRNRLKCLDQFINRQRRYSEYLLKTLKVEPRMLCSEKDRTFYNRYLFPVTFESTKQRDFMAYFLYRNGIHSIKAYEYVTDIANRYYNYVGDCPVSEAIAKQLLVIPTNYNLEQRDIVSTAKWFNAGWDMITSK